MRRNLDHHVIVSDGAGGYTLLDHPEVMIRPHCGTGGFRGWMVSGPGMSMQDGVCGNLPDVDRTLLRFGNCYACGFYGRRHGHPPLRCGRCHSEHEVEVARYKSAAAAAHAVERAWVAALAVRAAPDMIAAIRALGVEVSL